MAPLPVALFPAVGLDAVVTVSLVGDLDCFAVDFVERELDALVDDGVRRLVLDLGGLGFLDGAGLATLERARARAEEAGGWLVVRRPKLLVRRLVEVTRSPLLD